MSSISTLREQKPVTSQAEASKRLTELWEQFSRAPTRLQREWAFEKTKEYVATISDITDPDTDGYIDNENIVGTMFYYIQQDKRAVP